jgi:DNA-binding response OmpR family regulator
LARIIAIEDSPALQRFLVLTMRGTGIEIEAHLRGIHGLEAAIDDPPDLIILDLGLPDMSGWKILERLRLNATTANVPILVATGETRSVVIERLTELRAEMIEKPYSAAALREIVGALIDAPAEVGSPT